jgi:hypothetical protein
MGRLECVNTRQNKTMREVGMKQTAFPLLCGSYTSTDNTIYCAITDKPSQCHYKAEGKESKSSSPCA